MKQPITHYDLQIRIDETVQASLVGELNKAIEIFDDEYDYKILTPRLKNGTLKINSADLVHVLGFFDENQVDQVSFARLQSQLKKQLEMQLNKTLDSEARYHYQWTITALKEFETGRYLEDRV